MAIRTATKPTTIILSLLAVAVLAVSIAIDIVAGPIALVAIGLFFAVVLGAAAFIVSGDRRKRSAKIAAVAGLSLAVLLGLELAMPSDWANMPSLLLYESSRDFVEWRGKTVWRNTRDMDHSLIAGLLSEPPAREVASVPSSGPSDHLIYNCGPGTNNYCP